MQKIKLIRGSIKQSANNPDEKPYKNLNITLFDRFSKMMLLVFFSLNFKITK